MKKHLLFFILAILVLYPIIGLPLFLMDGVWTSEQIASAFFAIDLLWACAFGLVIFQEMKFTLRILYSSIIHMVINGQHVSKGQIILRMGNSGNSGGTHLHFSLFKNNIAIDPTLYIPLDYPRSF